MILELKCVVTNVTYCDISVPGSYADAASNSANNEESLTIKECGDPNQLLCPFSTNRECPYGEDCEYVHGTMCDLCGLFVLKPGDENQNEEHTKVRITVKLKQKYVFLSVKPVGVEIIAKCYKYI